MDEKLLKRINRLEKRYYQKLDKIVKLNEGIEYEYHKIKILEIEMDQIWDELDAILKGLGSSAWDYIVMEIKNLE